MKGTVGRSVSTVILLSRVQCCPERLLLNAEEVVLPTVVGATGDGTALTITGFVGGQGSHQIEDGSNRSDRSFETCQIFESHVLRLWDYSSHVIPDEAPMAPKIRNPDFVLEADATRTGLALRSFPLTGVGAQDDLEVWEKTNHGSLTESNGPPLDQQMNAPERSRHTGRWGMQAGPAMGNL